MLDERSPFRPNRRGILGAAAAGLVLGLPTGARGAGALSKPVRIGFIADLHHDLMPDAPQRMESFVAEMAKFRPDAIVQMGDFAHPKEENRPVIDRFKRANATALHVLGNHDTDAKHTVEQCLEVWGMPAPYYVREVEGLTLVVLNCNERGSPKYKAGYPLFVGKEQAEWLEKTLSAGDGPVLILSHQPLAGPGQIDNATEIQEILTRHRDRILLALCGHTHIDYLFRVGGIPYWHINSAAYYYVGGKFAHPSYAPEIHERYRVLASTCPYREALFASLTVDPTTHSITIAGRATEWVGPSPAAVKAELNPALTDGEEVAPRIRDRQVVRKPA